MQKTLTVVDLSAVRHNAHTVKELACGRKLFAVVKTDAYGHGAEECAAELEGVADAFCVAIVDEGVRLRLSGISSPILVLAPPLDEDDVSRARFYNLMLTVCDERSARLAVGCDVHIAVNTGMNRYGCTLLQLDRIAAIVGADHICGVYSHLYAPHDSAASASQLEIFLQAELNVKLIQPNAVAHLAASGGLLLGGRYLRDAVRVGLMLYGYVPEGFSCAALRKAMRVYARLAQSVDFIGGGVGYNKADRAYRKLYTYRLGYADGFVRKVPLGEKTLCMDAFISRAGVNMMPVMTDADEYAAQCGTISYEVLCSVSRRSERVYERSFTT